MTGLGIDVSTKRIAIAALPEPGTEFPFGVRVKYDVLELERHYGAQLWTRVRWVVHDYVGRMFPGAAVCLVENARPGITLMGCSIAATEAVQAATHRGAIVLLEQASVWKLHSVGKGNATKPEYIAHAQTLGVDTDDEDVCAAACMAQAAWDIWTRRVRRAA